MLLEILSSTKDNLDNLGMVTAITDTSGGNTVVCVICIHPCANEQDMNVPKDYSRLPTMNP